MIKNLTLTSGKTINRIKFQRINNGVFVDGAPNDLYTVQTACVVELNNHVVTGYANKLPTDNDDRRIGRKFALKRALEHLAISDDFTKEDRAEVWAALFEKSPKTKQ